MKKALALVLALCLTLSLAACGGAPAAPAPTPAPSAEAGTVYTAESPEIIKLAEMNAELLAACNEVAALAAENGWDTDEGIQAEFAAAGILVDTLNQIVEDPSMATGADMDATLATLQEALDNVNGPLKEKVSVPNGEAGASDAELTYSDVAVGDVIMTLPSVFADVTEQEGVFLCAAAEYGGAISVTPGMEIDLMPEEWDESLAAEAVGALYGSAYTDIQFAGFNATDDMNGFTAVYMAFTGVNANGQDRLVQIIRLYNADLTGLYQITLSHATEDPFFTQEMDATILNSVRLA